MKIRTKAEAEKFMSNLVDEVHRKINELDKEGANQCLELAKEYSPTNCGWTSYLYKQALIGSLAHRIKYPL